MDIRPIPTKKYRYYKNCWYSFSTVPTYKVKILWYKLGRKSCFAIKLIQDKRSHHSPSPIICSLNRQDVFVALLFVLEVVKVVEGEGVHSITSCHYYRMRLTYWPPEHKQVFASKVFDIIRYRFVLALIESSQLMVQWLARFTMRRTVSSTHYNQDKLQISFQQTSIWVNLITWMSDHWNNWEIRHPHTIMFVNIVDLLT